MGIMHTPKGKQSQRLVSARWYAKPKQKGMCGLEDKNQSSLETKDT